MMSASALYDMEYQEHSGKGAHHEMVWGFGSRFGNDDLVDTPLVSYSVPSRMTHTYNLFVQDDIDVTPGLFKVTVGTKLEHNSYTGLEKAQPTIRTLWTPGKKQVVWTSIAQAVRTPSRFERDATVQWELEGASVYPRRWLGAGEHRDTWQSELQLRRHACL